MAVIAVWQCDRDGSMFEDKKLAEEHDKYLELAANITSLVEAEVPGLTEQQAENIGLLLAQRRELLARACKGKPDALFDPFESYTPQTLGQSPQSTSQHGQGTTDTDSKVTALAANQ